MEGGAALLWDDKIGLMKVCAIFFGFVYIGLQL
jgi:hypothetical protein